MMKKLLFLIILSLIPLSIHAFTEERELFSQAESRYLTGNYALALESYREFIKKYPLSDLVPDAQYRRAVCLYRLGRYDESLQLLELVEKKYRSTRFIDYVPFWKGVIFFQTRRFQSSKENLSLFLDRVKDPAFVSEALIYLSLSNISEGTYAEAKESMARLAAMKGYGGLSQYEVVLYSYILLKVKDFEELDRLHGAVNPDSFPDEWKTSMLLYRAEGYLETGKIDQAQELYNKLLDAPGETASVAYMRLYGIAQRRQDFSRMELIVQRAEQKLADFPVVLSGFWLGLGIESYRRKDLTRAEFFLEKLWTERSSDLLPEQIPLYLSEVYLRNGSPERARKVLEEYLALSAEHGGIVYFRLGDLYLKNEDYEKASEAFAQYIEREPGGPLAQGAFALAAYCEYKRQRFDSALRYCDAFLASIGRGESGERHRGRSAPDEQLIEHVVRLKTKSLMEINRLDEAEKVLKEYSSENPHSVKVRLELMKLLFKKGKDDKNKYDAAVKESASLLEDYPDLKANDPHDYLVVQYLRGLSLISLKQYRDAELALAEITPGVAGSVGLSSILPFSIYYRAYALYRMDKIKIARDTALEFIASYPDHELYDEALDLGGWCSYSIGDFKKAEELFSALAGMGDGELSVKAHFLKGKTLRNMGRVEEAGMTFSSLYHEHPSSSYADDALFEYADVLLAKGEVRKAAERYLELWKNYPDSPLSKEALYKRGEVYFSYGLYTEAKGAFHSYRQNIEMGKLTDASLYWEGFSAQKLGEERGALVLWEDIIRSYPTSTFRPDAIRGAAEIHVSFGDYRKASDLYSALIDEYPEYARGVNAPLRLEEIRYMLIGMSRREAELTALISKSGGVRTKEGRKAMIELSRLYILENQKLERAFQMLSQVMQQEDPETSAAAGVLLGEYYFKMGDLERAGREFFQASLKNPQDRDLMAYGLYRAAEMMKLAGSEREMRELVDRLREHFPASEWSDEGKKLLEEKKK